MSNQIQIIKEKLNSAITQLCEISWMFVKDPACNFTRNRKLPLQEVIAALLCMEGGSLTGELLRYFGCSQHTASSSAVIQQRQKINEFAFPSLFDLFVRNTDKDRLYKGYRLLAADGSDIQIPADPKHTDSYFPGTNGQAPYSILPLDAVYDLLQHTYIDAAVCGRRDWNEKGVLCNADFSIRILVMHFLQKKVHPSPDALVRYGAAFWANVANLVTLAFRRCLFHKTMPFYEKTVLAGCFKIPLISRFSYDTQKCGLPKRTLGRWRCSDGGSE